MSCWKMVKNIIKGWFYKLFNKKQDLLDKRLPICIKCKHNVDSSLGHICDQCGCVIDAKARVSDEKCDLGKW